MKAKNIDGKIYVSEKPYFGHSETFCKEISVETLSCHSQIKTDRLKHVFSLSVLMFYRVYLFSKKLLRCSTHLLLIVLHTELEGRSCSQLLDLLLIHIVCLRIGLLERIAGLNNA